MNSDKPYLKKREALQMLEVRGLGTTYYLRLFVSTGSLKRVMTPGSKQWRYETASLKKIIGQ